MTRVLVVDDCPQFRRTTRLALEQAGFEVDVEADGERALSAVEEIGPDLMLLDLGLPDVSGFEVLFHLRNSSALPVIVLSGRPAEAKAALEQALALYEQKGNIVMAERVRERLAVGGTEFSAV